jgi:hypothetical protein
VQKLEENIIIEDFNSKEFILEEALAQDDELKEHISHGGGIN